jgi:TorA maturation chaperone TorD
MYQILSACYLYPVEKNLSVLKSSDFDGFAEILEGCYKDVDDVAVLRENLNELREVYRLSTVENLQSIYLRLVGHTISKECPLYEGQYGAFHVYQQVQDLADIQGFYKAFGLDISEEEKERCDHISVEFEFLQFLLYKHAYALEHDGNEKAVICEEALKKFMKEHVGRWVPLLAILFGRKAEKGFYYVLSSLTKEFLRLEMKMLGVKTEVLKESDLTQEVVAGAPDECLSCASSSDDDFME